MPNQLNGLTVDRVESFTESGPDTIFIPLPRALWTLCGGDGVCNCPECNQCGLPRKTAYWDTLAVSATKPKDGNDHTWTVHRPGTHPERLRGYEVGLVTVVDARDGSVTIQGPAQVDALLASITPENKVKWAAAYAADLAAKAAAKVIAMVAFTVAMVAGCAGDYPPPGFSPGATGEPRPGQTEAIDLVWRQQYGQGHAPPPVFWVYDPYLDCEGGRGWTENSSCWDGKYVHNEVDGPLGINVSGWHVEVAWPADTEWFGDTTLAHELCHAAFGDWDHEGDCMWGEGTRMGRATEALYDWEVPPEPPRRG